MDTVCPRKPVEPKTINLWLAILIIVLFGAFCLAAGYAIGYRYFWSPKLGGAASKLALYQAKIQRDPKDLDSLNRLAWLAYENKQYDLAINTCNKILALVPKDPNAHYIRGLVYFDQNQLALAEKEFFLLYQNYPKSPRALLGLARTYLAENLPDKAVTLLESLTKLDRAGADGHLYLGEAYAKTGQEAKSLAEFKQVLQLDPQNSTAKDWIEKLNNIKP